MASLRQVAGCIGLSGEFSIIRHFFGYGAAPKALSLLTQVRLVKTKHIGLNMIRVGVELFTNDDERALDGGLQFARDVFGAVPLGIGRVRHYQITLDEADGYEDIDSDCEASDMTEDWTVPNQSIDVFVVRTYASDGIGASPTGGPCDKDDKGPTGVLIAIEETRNFEGLDLTGKTLVHELAHYLGINHVDDDTNLMSHSTDGVAITSFQGAMLKAHCFVKQAC